MARLVELSLEGKHSAEPVQEGVSGHADTLKLQSFHTVSVALF